MAEFGRDSLVASVAFGWYGLIGQIFVRSSQLPPSTFLNEDLFFHWFGFPVQMLRGVAAVVVAVSVIRFMRAFDDEIKSQIEALQTLRLHEAHQREALRGDLLKRIVAAQEAERQRIARELHDETGQKLTAIGLGLQGVAASLGKDTNQAEKTLRKLQTLTAGSLDELQRLIADLRPSHLDDLGLPAALRWYIGEVKERTNLKIKFAVEGEERHLSEAVNIALFRVAQEALTNVIKHSQADSASIKLRFGNEQVKVSIKDDGCGFDVNQVNTRGRQAWGLLGMRERASLLGGEFELKSEQGEGARIDVAIPYQINGDNDLEEVSDHDSIVVG
jgi:signal transduction histidine kinase